MARVTNPNATTANPITAADKTALQDALLLIASNPEPTFDEIRAALPPAKRARATDGVIHQTAVELGLVVKR